MLFNFFIIRLYKTFLKISSLGVINLKNLFYFFSLFYNKTLKQKL